ncbi:trigger factor [Sulfobacillus thermosulfidooxidans DSM 9293]|uniref:Trigger factor n=1 Tax=Sulfobacillus thermosulfidooxidans (strain DSM 9293 / VKM B-1269 / AT-1) TaxID=929705 RepID=A0A1W1W8P6_SULTA|nr:trigger factor [Sulfobacillus thermosulfidooxidans]SMC02667.1 trigger factor [Sulfobacillus thermosulfidooxidans DSM 9293]
MQVALQRLPNSVAKVSVTIDPSDLSKAMDKAFRNVVGKYNIPGFRRGKVPRPIFERFVGREVILQEAAQQLVENRYYEALSEVSVEPVAEPKINIVKLDDGQPFEFDIEVESKPQIDLPDYQDLLQEPLEIPVPTDEQIDAELALVAKGQAQIVPADDEPVAKGNRIVVSLKGFLDDGEDDSEPFVDDDAYTIEVGAGTVVEGLEDQLVGLKVNEPQVIKLTYPENHPDVSLAGKPVRFELTVVENKRPDIPEVNDDLAKAVGLESLQELREQVTNNLKTRLEEQAKNARLQTILGKLKERVSVEVPSALVDQAIHNQLHELENTLARIGASTQEYLESRQITPEALHDELRPAAEERVKEELLLEAIAKQQGFEVSDEEVIQAIKPVADMYRQPLSDMVRLFRSSGEFEALRTNILLSKASTYLASTVAGGQGESEQ